MSWTRTSPVSTFRDPLPARTTWTGSIATSRRRARSAVAHRVAARAALRLRQEPPRGPTHPRCSRPSLRAASRGPPPERARPELRADPPAENRSRWSLLTKEPAASCRQGSGVIYAKVSPGGKLSDIGDDFSRFTAKQQPWMAARDDSAHHFAPVKVMAKGELTVESFAVPAGDA